MTQKVSFLAFWSSIPYFLVVWQIEIFFFSPWFICMLTTDQALENFLQEYTVAF